VEADGPDATGSRTVDLAWPGPGRVRLVQPADEERRAWLGDRAGRVHRLELTLDDPAGVRDAVAGADGTYTVDPAANRGVRLLLRSG